MSVFFQIDTFNLNFEIWNLKYEMDKSIFIFHFIWISIIISNFVIKICIIHYKNCQIILF